MKIFRFTALAVSIILAVLATQLLAHLTLDGFFPTWLLERAPFIAGYERFLPEDLLGLGQWMALLACLLFGVAVPTQIISMRRQVQTTPNDAGSLPFAILTALAFAIALLLAAMPALGLPGWVTTLIWLAGIALVFLLAETLERERSTRVLGDDSAKPEAGWPWLLAILALAVFLFTWRNSTLPLTYPTATVAAVLQAQDGGAMLVQGPLATGPAGVPYLATAWTALGQRLNSNPFRGLALSALVWGLAVVSLTWLLACELLRSPVRREGENAQGHGRSPALMAALVVTVSLASLHFARLPLLMEGVAWGTASLWAILRAVRTSSFRLAAAGGAAAGMGILLQPTGLIFLIVALTTWVGLALWRRRWLARALGGIGLRGVVVWAAAAAVTASPALCANGCAAHVTWFGGLPGAWDGLTNVLAAVGLPVAGSAASATTLTLVGAILAPLLLLSIGALIFHLDQMSGWVLLAWLGVGLAAAASLSATGVAWGAVLILLPAVGVAVAFAIDRLRAAVALVAGDWSRAAVTTLTFGLLLVTGLLAWRDYPAIEGGQDRDAATTVAVARWVGGHAQVPDFTVLTDGSTRNMWEEPLLRVATHGRTVTRRSANIANPGAWPKALPPGAQILVLPAAAGALDTLSAALGGGQISTWRDVRGNPLLYVFTVAGQ